MGAATMSALSDGRFCTSVEVELRFIRPAAAGTLIADVSVVYMGGASSISRPGFTTAPNGSWQPAPVPSPSSGTGSRPRPVSGLDQVTHRGESNGQRSERTSSQEPQLHRSPTMSWVRPLPTSISWWTNSWTSCRTTHATSRSTGSVKLYVQRRAGCPALSPSTTFTMRYVATASSSPCRTAIRARVRQSGLARRGTSGRSGACPRRGREAPAPAGPGAEGHQNLDRTARSRPETLSRRCHVVIAAEPGYRTNPCRRRAIAPPSGCRREASER